MRINADLHLPALAVSDALPWVAAPVPGVYRRMLERDGAEVARATSVVRYEAGCRFPWHEHGLGEEFYVLEGDFADEHGAYPAGTYVRNPPGSAHEPFTEAGCVLFVKLRQMRPDDAARVVVHTRETPWQEEPGGISRLPLHHDPATGETVALLRLAPGVEMGETEPPGGAEVLVLDGVLQDLDGRHPAGTWLRRPAGSRHAPTSRAGCTLWLKTGHLPG